MTIAAQHRCEHGFLGGCSLDGALEAAIERARSWVPPEHAPVGAPTLEAVPAKRLFPVALELRKPRPIDPESTVAELVQAAAAVFDVDPAMVMGRLRYAPIAQARQLVWLLCRSELGWSYPMLGRQFGRDHTTIMNGIASITRRLRDDYHLATRCAHLFAREA